MYYSRRNKRKKNFIPIILIAVLGFTTVALAFSTMYFKNAAKLAEDNLAENEKKMIQLAVKKIQEDDNIKKEPHKPITSNSSPVADNLSMYEQCYYELWGQFFQKNLMYCQQLELPIIRAVSEDNWNLINDVYIINFTNRSLKNAELSISLLYDEMSAFYYMPTDSQFITKENPPKEDWIELQPNESGNYVIPMSKIPADNEGFKYIAIKYTIEELQNYYGMLVETPD